MGRKESKNQSPGEKRAQSNSTGWVLEARQWVDALIWQVKCLSRVPESGVLTRLSLSFPKSSDVVEPFCVLTVSSSLAALSHKLPQGPTEGMRAFRRE